SGPLRSAIFGFVDLLSSSYCPAMVGVHEIHSSQPFHGGQLAPALSELLGPPDAFGGYHPAEAVGQGEYRLKGVLERRKGPMRATIGSDGRRRLEGFSVRDRANGDSLLVGWELEIGDDKAGTVLIVEILELPMAGLVVARWRGAASK